MENAISTENISLNFKKKKILDKICFDISYNDFVLFIGPNGAGKTSLFKILIGEYLDYSGSIKINNKDIKEYKHKELSQLISYIPQIIDVNQYITVKQLVALGRLPYSNRFNKFSKIDMDKIDNSIDLFGLNEKKEDYYCNLSGGEKQRCILAKTFVQEPKILLMDEPSNHLDYRAKKELLSNLIKYKENNDVCIILITHEFEYFKDIANKYMLLSKDSFTVQNEFTYEHINNTFGL